MAVVPLLFLCWLAVNFNDGRERSRISVQSVRNWMHSIDSFPSTATYCWLLWLVFDSGCTREPLHKVKI